MSRIYVRVGRSQESDPPPPLSSRFPPPRADLVFSCSLARVRREPLAFSFPRVGLHALGGLPGQSSTDATFIEQVDINHSARMIGRACNNFSILSI